MNEDRRSARSEPDPSDLPEGLDLLDGEEGPDAPAPLLAWPPPGLGRLRADLWRVVDRLAVGGAVFTLPLLAALTLSRDPWETGIFGDAWWVVLFSSALGLWFLLAGYVGLFRVFRRWRTAAGRGYGVRTVGLVLADRAGDTGFLVQGARSASVIGEGGRRAILTARLLQVGGLLGASLWLSAGFLLGVLLAARGMLGEGGLALWTLGPPAAAAVLAVVLRAWENGELRRARKAWFARSWTEELARDEIREWYGALGRRPGALLLPVPKPGRRGGSVSAAAALTVLVGLAVPLLGVALVVTSSVGPVISEIATPGFSTVSRKAAQAEALRSLRLPTDPDITPLEAGEALYAVTARGGARPVESMKEPPRFHEGLFPENGYAENPTGMAAHLWAEDLMPRVAGGLEPEVVDYLEQLGTHPALAELDVLARAEHIDELAALYRLPFPGDMTSFEIPIPRYSGFREVAYAQVGAAAADAARGRTDAAEARLRELVSAGLLLGFEGQTLLGSLVGMVMARVGADALVHLYDLSGRVEEADALRERRRAVQRAAELGAAGLGAMDHAEMSDLVTDSSAVRGMRWEYLQMLTGLGPCLNANRIVFGPPDDYEAWLERVRETLVRYESEEELFEVMRRGWTEGLEQGPVSRLLAQVMGGGAGACAALVEEGT